MIYGRSACAPPFGASMIAALVTATALLSGCTGSSTDAPAKPTSTPGQTSSAPIQFELGIYSGRADPAWTLTPIESARLDALVTALPQRLATPKEGGLGYHGFTVSSPAEIGGVAQRLVAFDGEVAAPGAGSRQVGIDPDRSVERFLLETGRTHLSAAEVAVVEDGLGVQP